MYIVSKKPLTKVLIIMKGRSTMEALGRHYYSQIIKANDFSNEKIETGLMDAMRTIQHHFVISCQRGIKLVSNIRYNHKLKLRNIVPIPSYNIKSNKVMELKKLM